MGSIPKGVRTLPPKPQKGKQRDFEQEGETKSNDPMEPEDFEPEKFPPLVDKNDLIGQVLVIESWRERTGDNGEYLIFKAKKGTKEIAFSSGQVLADQARERNGPFRAKLILVERDREGKKLSHAYFSFASPK